MAGRGNPNWKPGVSGNPSGKRPASITPFLEAIGAEIYGDSGKTRFEMLARAMWNKAIDDQDYSVCKWITERLDGLPVAKQEISGADGEPVKLVIEYVDKAE